MLFWNFSQIIFEEYRWRCLQWSQGRKPHCHRTVLDLVMPSDPGDNMEERFVLVWCSCKSFVWIITLAMGAILPIKTIKYLVLTGWRHLYVCNCCLMLVVKATVSLKDSLSVLVYMKIMKLLLLCFFFFFNRVKCFAF